TAGKQILPAQNRRRRIANLDIQQTDVEIRLPSDHLSADSDRNLDGGVLIPMKTDAPGEEGNQIRLSRQTCDVEDAGALEKERPLLRKEERKPRQIDLTNVRLGLREVGVDRDRRIQIRCEVFEN